MGVVGIKYARKDKQMNNETQTPDPEELAVIIRRADEARALMITNFFRRLFHRPAHKPVGTARTA